VGLGDSEKGAGLKPGLYGTRDALHRNDMPSNSIHSPVLQQELAIADSFPVSETVSFDDLRFLAHVQGPCITLAIAFPDPAQVQARLKNAIRDIERGLSGRGVDARLATELLDPLRSFAAEMEAKGKWSIEPILFRARDILRCFQSGDLSREYVMVGERFQVRPLLPLITRDQRFNLLALSQKHVRLFHCTRHASQEIPLGAHVPQSLEVWLHNKIPDHVLDNRSTAGPSLGSMKGVLFGTSTDRERHDEYLKHFFQEIDKGLRKILTAQDVPLLLAGVESEVTLYRKINNHFPLMEPAIHGSPDGLSQKELFAKALESVKSGFSEPLRKILRQFKDFRDTNRLSSSILEILKLARAGRVADLLIREDAECRGTWDGSTVQIRNGSSSAPDEDLLNLAALETLSHGGQAFALKPSEMPEESDVTAFLRF
jgi:hypothetical protein